MIENTCNKGVSLFERTPLSKIILTSCRFNYDLSQILLSIALNHKFNVDVHPVALSFRNSKNPQNEPRNGCNDCVEIQHMSFKLHFLTKNQKCYASFLASDHLNFVLFIASHVKFSKANSPAERQLDIAAAIQSIQIDKLSYQAAALLHDVNLKTLYRNYPVRGLKHNEHSM